MSVISGPGSSALASAGEWLPQAAPPLSQGAKAARDFEAQLIGMVLESMEKTFAGLPGQDAIAGEDNYNYMGAQALAQTMAAGGGFGIARMIMQSFERTKGGGGAERSEGPDL